MSQVARIGMIGNGGFTDFLLRSWREIEDIEVTAIAARNPERLAATAKTFDIPHQFAGESGWRDMLRDAPVDIVVIVTPPNLHAEMAVAALEADMAVLCEKPLATTLHDARRIRAAVEKSGKPLAVNFVMRYNPLFQAVKKVVDERLLGELHRVDFTNLASDEGLPPEHWFWDLEQCGGILVEHGVHFFDVYSWIIGSTPARVDGHRTVRPGTTQEDRVMATVLYESGVLATFYHAFDRPSRMERQTALLSFDQGTLEVSGWTATHVEVDAAVTMEAAERLLKLLPPEQEYQGTAYEAADRAASGGGNTYDFDRRLTYRSRFAPDQGTMYAHTVREVLKDLLAAWRDPSHHVAAGVEQGVQSLEIACAV